MKKIFLAVIAVIVVLAGGLMLSYNGLAGSKEAVETAEADVDTMLQRLMWIPCCRDVQI